MTQEQKQFLNILNNVIFEKNIESDTEKTIDWNEIKKIAEKHNLLGLIYYTVKNKEILESWKKDVFISNVNQIRHINQISKILRILNKKKIPAIVLKGLVLREIYPKPELRTMIDADLIIKKERLNEVKSFLLNEGYNLEEEEYEHHLFFYHPDHMNIEVHWDLASDAFLDKKIAFESCLWEKIRKIKIQDEECYALEWEEMVIHLCVHMMSHISAGGFGVKQLFDLALLSEKKKNDIDWKKVAVEMQKSEIEKAAVTIFYLCEEFFKVEIPKEIKSLGEKDEKALKILTDYAFEKEIPKGKTKIYPKVKRYIALVFPNRNKMAKKYGYSKKGNFLLGIAWIHRIIKKIFEKNKPFSNRVKDIKKRMETSEILEKLEL